MLTAAAGLPQATIGEEVYCLEEGWVGAVQRRAGQDARGQPLVVVRWSEGPWARQCETVAWSSDVWPRAQLPPPAGRSRARLVMWERGRP